LNRSYADEVFKIIAEDLKLSLPEYVGPTVRLKSSNSLPALVNSRKRKMEENDKKEENHVKTDKSQFQFRDGLNISERCIELSVMEKPTSKFLKQEN